MATPYIPVPAELSGAVTLPDDGDLATAQSVNDPFKEILDAAQLSQNKLNGTTNGATLTNPTIQGIVTVINNGPDRFVSVQSQDITLDDDSSLTLNGGGSAPVVTIDRQVNILSGAVEVDSGAVAIVPNTTVTGLVTCNGGLTVNTSILTCASTAIVFSGSCSTSGASLAVGNKIVLSGTGRIVKRCYDVADLAGVTTAVGAADGDVIFLATQTANVSINIPITSMDDGTEIEFTCLRNGTPQITNPARVVTLRNGDATSIGGGLIIGGVSGAIATVQLIYRTSTKWEIVSRYLIP